MEEDYLIKKWLNNTLTEKEQIAFDALDNSAFLKEILAEGKRFKNQHSEKVLTFKDFETKLEPHPKKMVFYNNPFIKIAAVILLCIAIYFIFRPTNQHTFKTELSQTVEVTLPDASLVTLNELSQLNVASNWSQKREVTLEGEAYFKVASGKRFDVKTQKGVVTVIGTQFNVTVRDSIFSVKCYEGLVQVSYNNTLTELPAGRAFQVVNNTVQNSKISTMQPSWLLDMKVFKNALLSDVLMEIERHYKVSINATSVDDTLLFTGGFELNSLDNALQAVTGSLNLSYTVDDNQITVFKNESY